MVTLTASRNGPRVANITTRLYLPQPLGTASPAPPGPGSGTHR